MDRKEYYRNYRKTYVKKTNFTGTCTHCNKEYKVYISPNRPKPKYCSLDCFGEHNRYPFVMKNGYKMVIEKGHPRANDHGYVREHILVMEKKLGRLVPKGESIHHIDGDKTNNHPDNLQIFRNHTEHLLHHWRENSLRSKNVGRHLSY